MRITEDISYYASLLGRDKPEVQRMVQHARLHPEESHVIRKHMLYRLRKLGFSLADPQAFGPGPERTGRQDGIFAGEIVFGKQARKKLLIPIDSFSEHTLVSGHSGSGKSFFIRMLIPQFVSKGISVWIFDSENEYRSLLKK